ncbi:fumarate hydratase class II [Cutibacterium acnes JCM 18918]|nr:fumarate hydratase class II [Cutibacterium acnes JCM 18918]
MMVGRTHLQDATPIRLGQVISAGSPKSISPSTASATPIHAPVN